MALPLTSLRGVKPEKSADGTTSPDGDGSSRRILRIGILIVGLLALVYVASRRAGGPEISQPAEPLEEAIPDRSDEGLPGEERSREELVERAEESVRKEPAEPGEMTVEEDIVDDVVEEAEEGSADRESDETETSGEEENETSGEEENETSGESGEGSS